MRKLLLVAVTAVLLVQLTPASADTKAGTILLPSPIVGSGDTNPFLSFDCNWVQHPNCEKGIGQVHRRLYLAAGAATNGIFGVTFKVAETGSTFTLRSEPSNSADFDITFYKDLGALPATNPTPYCSPAPCGPKTSFAKLGNGAETGTVPLGTKFAIITCTCANAKFVYTA